MHVWNSKFNEYPIPKTNAGLNDNCMACLLVGGTFKERFVEPSA